MTEPAQDDVDGSSTRVVAPDLAGVPLPIDVVARRLGLRASAIRFYEERGLVEPISRHGGRRWYGPDAIRRLAIIQYWQECGSMSLDEIGQILGGPHASRQWKQVIEGRIAALSAQIERMTSARELLEHVISHHDYAPDGCPYYEALIWDREARHLDVTDHDPRPA